MYSDLWISNFKKNSFRENYMRKYPMLNHTPKSVFDILSQHLLQETQIQMIKSVFNISSINHETLQEYAL